MLKGSNRWFGVRGISILSRSESCTLYSWLKMNFFVIPALVFYRIIVAGCPDRLAGSQSPPDRTGRTLSVVKRVSSGSTDNFLIVFKHLVRNQILTR